MFDAVDVFNHVFLRTSLIIFIDQNVAFCIVTFIAFFIDFNRNFNVVKLRKSANLARVATR